MQSNQENQIMNLDVEVEPKLEAVEPVINEEPKLIANPQPDATKEEAEDEKVDLIQLMNGVENKTTSWKRKWWEQGQGQAKKKHKVDKNPEAKQVFALAKENSELPVVTKEEAAEPNIKNENEEEEINLIELMNSRPQEIQIKALPAADTNGVIKYFGYMDTYFGGTPPIPVTNIIYSNDDFNEVKTLTGEI